MVAPVMIFFEWVCSDGVALVLVLLGIFDGLGFKSAVWVSDRWLGYFRRFSRYFRQPRFQIGSLGLLISGLGIFGYFRCFSGLIIGIFFRYFRRSGFQIGGMGLLISGLGLLIDGLGGGCGGRCWLQLF